MINKENGVTLISLIITIVVLMIIFTITINYGVSTIHQVSNNKMESELSIVQEAIMQNYALLISTGNTSIKPTSTTSITEDETKKPKQLIGTRIINISELTSAGFQDYKISYDNLSELTYEQYYYKLEKDALLELGIERGSDATINDEPAKESSYIVNYSTGEVFDVANKTYYDTDTYDADSIYLKPSDSSVTLDSYEFNN